MTAKNLDLNSPERVSEIRSLLHRKHFLKKWYAEQYNKFAHALNQVPEGGDAIEIGSGGGFAKEIIPTLVTTDIIPYPGVDQKVDALHMPFADRSIRAVFLLNVFHHIPDASRFLSECSRVLKPGGRVFMVEPYPGWIAKPILKFAHHEPFDDQAEDWKFASSGPLSDANGALPWLVFVRDRSVYTRKFPELKIAQFTPHSPLRYWLSGGLKNWSLGTRHTYGLWSSVDDALSRFFPKSGSFVDIELVREG